MDYPAAISRPDPSNLRTVHVQAFGLGASDEHSPWWSLRVGGHWRTGPAYGCVRSGYPGHQVMCLLRGRGTCRYRGQEMGAGAGEAVLMDLREPHAYHSDPADPWELCWMIVDGPRIGAVFAELTGDGPPVVPISDLARMRRRFARIFALVGAHPPGAAAWIDHEIAGVFADLLTARQVSAGRAGPGPRAPATPISRVLDHLRREPARQHALADLARLAGWSPGHFAHRFKAATGLTAFAYLEGLRTAQAQELLRGRPDLAIADIGRRIGYADPAYFSRVFRRCAGVAPRAYRVAFTGARPPDQAPGTAATAGK